MNFSKLDRVIAIQESTTTLNEFGEPVKTWVTLYGNVWASVEPISGRELTEIKQIQSEVDTRFRVRYVEGVTEKMRIKYRSEYYGIQSIINTGERNSELVIMTVKVK